MIKDYFEEREQNGLKELLLCDLTKFEGNGLPFEKVRELSALKKSLDTYKVSISQSKDEIFQQLSEIEAQVYQGIKSYFFSNKDTGEPFRVSDKTLKQLGKVELTLVEKSHFLDKVIDLSERRFQSNFWEHQ